MSDIDQVTGPGGLVEQQWDYGARTYTDFRTSPPTVRAFNAQENAEADARALAATITTNEADLLAKAQQALSVNATFLALASPTNAQTLAQVKALTRQVNALIRLEIRDLADVSGT